MAIQTKVVSINNSTLDQDLADIETYAALARMGITPDDHNFGETYRKFHTIYTLYPGLPIAQQGCEGCIKKIEAVIHETEIAPLMSRIEHLLSDMFLSNELILEFSKQSITLQKRFGNIVEHYRNETKNTDLDIMLEQYNQKILDVFGSVLSKIGFNVKVFKGEQREDGYYIRSKSLYSSHILDSFAIIPDTLFYSEIPEVSLAESKDIHQLLKSHAVLTYEGRLVDTNLNSIEFGRHNHLKAFVQNLLSDLDYVSVIQPSFDTRFQTPLRLSKHEAFWTSHFHQEEVIFQKGRDGKPDFFHIELRCPIPIGETRSNESFIFKLEIPADAPNNLKAFLDPTNIENAKTVFTPMLSFFTYGGIFRIFHVYSNKQKLLIDSRTGFISAGHLGFFVDNAIANCIRNKKDLTIAFVDLDLFANFNAALGHAAGNTALNILGRFISERIRKGIDIAVRAGGDEFVFIFPDTNPETIYHKLAMWRSEFRTYLTPAEKELFTYSHEHPKTIQHKTGIYTFNKGDYLGNFSLTVGLIGLDEYMDAFPKQALSGNIAEHILEVADNVLMQGKDKESSVILSTEPGLRTFIAKYPKFSLDEKRLTVKWQMFPHELTELKSFYPEEDHKHLERLLELSKEGGRGKTHRFSLSEYQSWKEKKELEKKESEIK